MNKNNDYSYQKLNGDVSRSEEMEIKDNEVCTQPKQEIEEQTEKKEQKEQTIDVVLSMQQGEFNPFLLCLQEHIVDLHFQDTQGYSIIHHLASYGQLALLKYLHQHFQADFNQVSANGQTPLMIACNYGHLDVLHYLLAKHLNVQINLQDNCLFTAIMFCAKENYVIPFIYLLAKGADLSIRDSLNCTISHWCGYKNNVFLLRLMNRLKKKLPYDHLLAEDNSGYIPIQRALFSESSESVELYLAQAQQSQQLGTVLRHIHQDIQAVRNRQLLYILHYYQSIHYHSLNFTYFIYYLQNIYQAYTLPLCLTLYVTLFYSQYQTYLTIFINNNNNNNNNNDYSSMTNWLKTMYLITLLLVTHLIRSPPTSTQPQVFNKVSRDSPIQMHRQVEGHNNIDEQQLQQQQQQQKYQHLNQMVGTEQITFLHIVCELMESRRFSEIEDTDWLNRYCPSCLHYKPPKSKHITSLDTCVPGYHSYSPLYHQHLTYDNHYLYLFILLLQQLIFYHFHYAIVSHYYSSLTSWTFLYLQETAIILYRHYGIQVLFLFLANIFLLFFNTLFLSIELYGISIFQTFNELLHRTRYRYLYTPYEDKSGNLFMVYANQGSHGFFKNIKYYFKVALKNIIG